MVRTGALHTAPFLLRKEKALGFKRKTGKERGKLHTWVRIPPDAFMAKIGRIPGTEVFVGSHLLNPNLFKVNHIKAVFTIMPIQLEDKNRFLLGGIKLISIPIIKNNLYGSETVSNFLKITKKQKGNFAVTCMAGTGASNVFAGIYLMAVKRWPFEKVMTALGGIKPYRPYGIEVVEELKQVSSRLSVVKQKISAKRIFNIFRNIKRTP